MELSALAIVIPTLNAAQTLPALLKQTAGVSRVVVSDGGSSDATLSIAAQAGVVICIGSAGRGHQLARGCDWAGDAQWLLVLHADCVLPECWQDVVMAHLRNHPDRAGYFRFGGSSAVMRAGVRLRELFLELPYGDQGLLISRTLYAELGGYARVPLFEDVIMVQKLRGRLRRLPARLGTDISAHRRDGVWRRSFRNLRLLSAFLRGTDPHALAVKYA